MSWENFGIAMACATFAGYWIRFWVYAISGPGTVFRLDALDQRSRVLHDDFLVCEKCGAHERLDDE